MCRDCDEVRDAISALADGELAPVGRREIEAHVATCAPCEAFETRLAGLTRQLRVALAPAVPDQTASILHAIGQERSRAASGPSRRLRLVLSLIGAAQLLAAVPLLLGVGGLSVHAGRELAAFEVALAVGFLVSAWQPQRAWGVLPIAAVVVGLTIAAAAADVVGGGATLATELPHLLEAGGVAVLWAVATRSRGGADRWSHRTAGA